MKADTPEITPDFARPLFWSERGEIACDDHAPGGDTWLWDKWQRMTVVDRLDMHRESGKPADCETCASIKRLGR